MSCSPPRMDGYATSEHALAEAGDPRDCPLACCVLCGPLRLQSYSLWSQGRSTGADLLWRVGKTFLLPPDKKLPDGSFLSYLYPSVQDRQRKRNAVMVRVIEYRLEGVADAEPGYAPAAQQCPRRQAKNERLPPSALPDAAGVLPADHINR